MNADSIVFLNSGYSGRLIRVGDIAIIEVSKNDLTITLKDGTTVVARGKLVRCAKKLPAELFFVTGRNCMVNLSQVSKVDTSARNIILTMKDGRKVMISRKQSVLFRKELVL